MGCSGVACGVRKVRAVRYTYPVARLHGFPSSAGKTVVSVEFH